MEILGVVIGLKEVLVAGASAVITFGVARYLTARQTDEVKVIWEQFVAMVEDGECTEEEFNKFYETAAPHITWRLKVLGRSAINYILKKLL